MGDVISFVNAKGGVGKTSLSLTMADELSRIGKKVLLIDFDSQSTLSQFFAMPLNVVKEHRIENLYRNERIEPFRVKENLDVIFSTRELQDIAESSKPGKEFYLKKYLKDIKAREVYDFIIIDPPGSLGFYLVSVILASDITFIPQRVNLFDNTGTKMLLTAMFEQAQLRDMRIRIGGFIPVFFENRRKNLLLSNMEAVQKLYMKFLSTGYLEHVGEDIWLPKIRKLSVWEDSVDEGMFIRDFVEKKDRTKINALDDIEALRDAILEVSKEDINHIVKSI